MKQLFFETHTENGLIVSCAQEKTPFLKAFIIDRKD